MKRFLKTVVALSVLSIALGDTVPLINNQDEPDCEDWKEYLKYVGLGALIGAVSVPLLTFCCLNCIGFTCGGVRGNSTAAGQI